MPSRTTSRWRQTARGRESRARVPRYSRTSSASCVGVDPKRPHCCSADPFRCRDRLHRVQPAPQKLPDQLRVSFGAAERVPPPLRGFYAPIRPVMTSPGEGARQRQPLRCTRTERQLSCSMHMRAGPRCIGSFCLGMRGRQWQFATLLSRGAVSVPSAAVLLVSTLPALSSWRERSVLL